MNPHTCKDGGFCYNKIAISNSLFSPIRAAMIRDENRENPPRHGETEACEIELAEKYCCSPATVHAIVMNVR